MTPLRTSPVRPRASQVNSAIASRLPIRLRQLHNTGAAPRCQNASIFVAPSPDMLPHSDDDEIARKLLIRPAVAPAAVVATAFDGPAGFDFAHGSAFATEGRGSDA